MTLMPKTGWAMWFRNRVIVIPHEIIAQIRAAPTETPGWFEEELGYAWKHLSPITPVSIRTGKLPLDHNAWSLTPNPWWKFYIDMPEISLEAAEELNRPRWSSVVPHWDESGWIIQERKLVDFRGMATAH